MRFSEIRKGDHVTDVNGEPLPAPLPVIEVTPDHSKVRLPDTASGIQCWLYADQHEVEVELLLPPSAQMLISDSLLMMKERLTREGHPHVQVSELITFLHRFSAPDCDTDVVIRPRPHVDY